MVIQVGDRHIGPGEPTFLVAEMAWSHDGSREHAAAIIRAAAAAGADAVNVHVTSLRDYMVRDYTAGRETTQSDDGSGSVYEYLERISLDWDDWRALGRLASDLQLPMSCLCNDYASLEFAVDELDPHLLMIHPSCIKEDRFVAAAAQAGRPLVLYIGGLTLGEVDRAVQTARDEGNPQVILQHGFQSYPTPVEDNNLDFIATLSRLYGVPIAFGDHTDGADPFALVVPLLAIARGASVIEKHLTYDRSVQGEDFESALGPETFSTFVRWVRSAEQTFGSSALRPLSDRELKYREIVLKRAVTSRPLPAGHLLREDDIVFKRSDTGLTADELRFVVGGRIQADLPADAPITRDEVS